MWRYNIFGRSAHRIKEFPAVVLKGTAHPADDLLLLLSNLGPVALQVFEGRLPLAHIFGHQPIDESTNLLLDLVGRVGHDLALELALDALGVDQVQDAGQA